MLHPAALQGNNWRHPETLPSAQCCTLVQWPNWIRTKTGPVLGTKRESVNDGPPGSNSPKEEEKHGGKPISQKRKTKKRGQRSKGKMKDVAGNPDEARANWQ